MSQFYEYQFGSCDVCHAPATHEIRGPFNARYGQTCVKHVKRRIAELEKAHERTALADMPRS